MALFVLSILLPFLNVIAISLSSDAAIKALKVSFWPVGLQVFSYKQVLGWASIWRAAGVTLFETVVGTTLTILTSVMTAYSLYHKSTPIRKPLFIFFLITMYIGGGTIPTFRTVIAYGMYNTIWALILPGVVSVFYIIVFKNNFDQMPKDLFDSSEIDGAGVFQTLWFIVIPLVMPMIAAFTIMTAVGNWNDWYNVLLYVSDRKLWTLQYKLRDILQSIPSNNAELNYDVQTNLESVKMAALLSVTLPVIVVYPFLQRFFVHGVFVGAVKG
jgi:ABC-type glycerol-3-phosphate transport system permease component